MDKLTFMREFFKHWRTVGSITPSSKWLVRKMLKPLDFRRANVVVELGPGLGCVTKALLKRMKPTARLIVLEMNEDFCQKLRMIKDSRLIVYHQSALELKQYLGNEQADYVVSGIPLALLPTKDKSRLLSLVRNGLAQDGRFVQFQYSLESYQDLKSTFKAVNLDFTVLNIPPAFVYSCLKQ